MKLLEGKRDLIFIYTFFALFGGIVLIINKYLVLHPWILLLTFFFLITSPGFALSRICKIEFLSDLLGQFILWITLGFVFIFSLNFMAMLAGLTIQDVNTLYWGLLMILFLIAICF